MRHRALTRTARAATAGLVLLVVAATTACNPGRPPAATVGGTDISAQRVDQMLDAFVEGAPDTYRGVIEGRGEGTTQMGAAAAILNTLVLQVLQAELAADAGVIPSEEDIDEATGLVQASFVGGAAQPDDTAPTAEATTALEQSTAIYEAMPTDLQEWLVDLRATTLAYADSLGATDEQAREAYEADPSAYDLLCLRAIVVEPADVTSVQERLDAGEDFGQVSSEVTIDEQLAAAGGELGECLTTTQLGQVGLDPTVVDLIVGLDSGEATGSVDLGDGLGYWFEVQERQEQPFEAVAEEIKAGLSGEVALQERVQEGLSEVDVRVDPRFGRWDPETGTITPPDGSRAPGGLPVEDELVPVAGG